MISHHTRDRVVIVKQFIICCLVLFQSETEWQRFQRHCLEIVAKLAELLPGETFSLLVMIDLMCVSFLNVLAQKLVSEINFSTIVVLLK